MLFLLKLSPARRNEALITVSITSSCPVEKTTQIQSFGIFSLDADCTGHIERDEALVSIAVNERSSCNALVNICALDEPIWQIAIVELSCTLERLSWSACLTKISGVDRDTQENLAAGESLGNDIVNASLARLSEGGIYLVEVFAGWE